MHFLCLQSKSFLETSIFHFGINIGIVIPKTNSERINYREESNLSSQHEFGRLE